MASHVFFYFEFGFQKLTYEDQVRIASEMRHSETAFIQLINQSDSYDKSYLLLKYFSLFIVY